MSDDIKKELGELAGLINEKHNQLETGYKGAIDTLAKGQLAELATTVSELVEKQQEMERSAATKSRFGSSEDNDQDELKGIFTKYMRKGDSALTPEETKSLSVNTDPDGGYTVTPAMSSTISKRFFETSPIRSIASIETISTDSLDFIIDDNEATSGGWTGEETAPTETNTPQIGKGNIPVHEQFAMPYATQKLLDDSSIDMESWLADAVADILGRTENTAFVAGNGVAKPRGFIDYDAWTTNTTSSQLGVYERNKLETINSGTAGAVTADSLILMQNSLFGDEYQANAQWVMNRHTFGGILQLKNGNSEYRQIADFSQDGAMTILGRPVTIAKDMPIAASASISVAYGDFKRGYKIVDRLGIRVQRDPFTSKPFIKFYTTKRVGGMVTEFQAIKLLKLSV